MGGSHELNLISVSLVGSSHCTAGRCSQVPIRPLIRHSDGGWEKKTQRGDEEKDERSNDGEKASDNSEIDRSPVGDTICRNKGQEITAADSVLGLKHGNTRSIHTLSSKLLYYTFFFFFFNISGSMRMCHCGHMICIFFCCDLCQKLQHLLSSD